MIFNFFENVSGTQLLFPCNSLILANKWPNVFYVFSEVIVALVI